MFKTTHADQESEPPNQCPVSDEEGEPPSNIGPSNHALVYCTKKRESESGVRTSRGSRRKAIHRPALFPNVGTREWNDWHWQLKNRFTTLSDISRFLQLSDHEKAAGPDRGTAIPMSITPYYMTLVDPWDAADPIRRSVIPSFRENLVSPGELEDPLGEEEDSPVPGLVHRYPDRVLLLATNRCSVYCRYCTRSRVVGRKPSDGSILKRWERCIEYIEQHTEVRDVLVSGGDPLVLEDDLLDHLLSRLRRIRHVEILRIGTKAPVVLPQRITASLVRVLRRHHPLWMNIHFTHPRELTPETTRACERLADAGIPLGSQTVLLRGINDDVATMTSLYQGLLRLRVRPYYLYQCDRIKGSAHFTTPVSKGIEIIKGLRGFTTGLAVPHYVIDAPGGGGKIPLLPEYCLGADENGIALRSYSGETHHYPDFAMRTGGPETLSITQAETP